MSRTAGRPFKRRVTAILAGFFIATFFVAFTWRELLMYFSGDDVMNLYGYWSRPAADLVKANILFWTPYYRPFGGLIYRTLFALFGFNPHPLYILYYASFLLNLYLAYVVLKRISGSAETGALATLIWSVHANFAYLYYNAGSLYDVYCFLFLFLALLVYIRVRERGEYLIGWSLVAFIVSFICCLNSKEMGATLPAILILYELLFHTPHWRRLSDAGKWLIHEGRGALVAGICVIGYIPAKTSAQGLARSAAYVSHFTWPTFLHDTGVYLGYLTYSSHPFTSAGVMVFYGLLALVALLLRSRLMWFGLLFFQITLLPVSFVSAREGFVLYLPNAGLALYFAVLLIWIKDKLLSLRPRFLRISDSLAITLLFALTGVALGVIHYQHWQPVPPSSDAPIKIAKEQLLGMYPKLKHGSSLLIVQSPLDGGVWDLFFTLRLIYLDKDLFITQLNGPSAQQVPLDQLDHYDHIFSYQGDRYVELDNADTRRSVRLRLVKANQRGARIGENMTISSADAYQYFVDDIIMCPPKSVNCWTLDAPELKFWLSSTRDRIFSAQFNVAKDTFQQTGPLVIDYFVNNRLLERVRYTEDGDHTYRHAVPADWLRTDDYTIVKMQVRNPYIAPADGAKLGVLLVSAGFGN
ncbi:MAG TPA: hypothetical protein VK776_14470 [Bryobacteraceae bacterium]|nr:hypothetical protein [Bryobacteraceae bacterium]